jgi:hypothetical protein
MLTCLGLLEQVGSGIAGAGSDRRHIHQGASSDSPRMRDIKQEFVQTRPRQIGFVLSTHLQVWMYM